jgi:hypothetical protein
MDRDRLVVCPSCGAKTRVGDFLCVKCETILDGAALAEAEPGEQEPTTLVREMLSPPSRSLRRPDPRPPPAPKPQPGQRKRRTTPPTALFAMPASLSDVAEVVADLDAAANGLSDFDAFVVSLVDGTRTVGELRREAGIAEAEIQAVLHTLLERGVVRVFDPGRPAAASSRAPARQEVVGPIRAERPRRTSPVEGPWASRLQRAIALQKDGKMDEAIREIERAIEASANPAPLYNRLALALVKARRDFAQAERLLCKAVALDPNNATYFENLAEIAALNVPAEGRRAPAPIGRKR